MSRLPIDAIFGEQVLERDVRMTPEEPVRQLFEAFRSRGRSMPPQVLDPCAAGELRPFAALRETVIVTNPPYSIAREIAESCFKAEPDTIALLLRCNHLGSNPWRPFWTAHRPTAALYVRRPSFTGDGKTDASEYVWVLWQEGAPPLDLDWI